MFAFYKTDTGEILSLVDASSQPTPPSGHGYAGYVHSKDQMNNYEVSNGVVQKKLQSEIDAMELSDAQKRLRRVRDQMLASSDWTQSSDAPVNQAAWAAYRQQLRDLPANTTDPANPAWPSPPS